MFAARMSGLNKFEMLGIKGQVSADGKYLHTAERPDTLFGSSLTMDEAFINLLNWLTTEMEGVWNEYHPPLDFDEALIKASNMCSKNPAKVLGIFNSSEKNIRDQIQCRCNFRNSLCRDRRRSRKMRIYCYWRHR